jgi:hypothetical protein
MHICSHEQIKLPKGPSKHRHETGRMHHYVLAADSVHEVVITAHFENCEPEYEAVCVSTATGGV